MFDADLLARTTCDLVAVPSVTGDEADAIRWVEARLRAAGGEIDAWTDAMASFADDPDFPGYEVPRDTVPVVAGRLVGRRTGPKVALTGHVDVVPATDLDAWGSPPFSPVRREGRVFGRGAADMKGGLAAALAVYERFARAPDFAGELWLVAVPGEEDGGSGTLAAIRRGVRPDVVIIPEPTADAAGAPRAVVATAGAITVEIKVHGCAAHAAFRREGHSALEAFAVLQAALRDAEARLNEGETDARMAALGLPYPTNVGRIEGGDWASTVMGSLRAEIRAGVALGESVSAAEARVVGGLLDAARAAGGWLAEHPPEVRRFGGAYRSARTPDDDPVVQAILRSSAAAFGRPAALAAMPYGCDMGLWRGLCDASCVVYGPGRARVAHTNDEWIGEEALAGTTLALYAAVAELLDAR